MRHFHFRKRDGVFGADLGITVGSFADHVETDSVDLDLAHENPIIVSRVPQVWPLRPEARSGGAG